MLWAFGISAVRTRPGGGMDGGLGAGTVEAANKHEAWGKAMVIAQRSYPASAGWYAHNVAAAEVGGPTDPETVGVADGAA